MYAGQGCFCNLGVIALEWILAPQTGQKIFPVGQVIEATPSTNVFMPDARLRKAFGNAICSSVQSIAASGDGWLFCKYCTPTYDPLEA